MSVVGGTESRFAKFCRNIIPKSALVRRKSWKSENHQFDNFTICT